MQKKYRKIITNLSRQVISKYAKSRNVLGIFLIGSAAQGTFDRYSDVDFFIVLKKQGGAKQEKITAKTGIAIELLFNTSEEVKQYLQREKLNIRRNVSHMLATGMILYQSSPFIRKLQNAAKKNIESKTKYSKGEIMMHKYSLEDFLEDARRDVSCKNTIAFYLDSCFFIQNAIDLLLKLNGNFYRKPKEMKTLLQHIDSNFLRLLQNFYAVKSLKAKLKTLERISQLITKRSGGALPSRWTL